MRQWRRRCRSYQRGERKGTIAMTSSSRGLFGGGGRRDCLEHQFHFVNFSRLIRDDIAREPKYGFVVSSVAMAEELIHHVDGATMVTDHAREKQSVEVAAASLVQRCHLLVREHAGHHHLM